MKEVNIAWVVQMDEGSGWGFYTFHSIKKEARREVIFAGAYWGPGKKFRIRKYVDMTNCSCWKVMTR